VFRGVTHQYLSPDVARLRELLLRRRAELKDDWTRSLAQPHADHEVLPMRQHLEDALVEVGRALQRIDNGTFGTCVDCAAPIEWDRLLANPSVARCWACQQSAESQAGPRSH
jgi:RNA polymerase-binding transcription factor DksA